MIIYFLIENVDVDRRVSGPGPERRTPVQICTKGEKVKKEGKRLPKGMTLTTMQYSPSHSSLLRVENGRKKTAKLVDQKNLILTSATSASPSGVTPLKRPFWRCLRVH